MSMALANLGRALGIEQSYVAEFAADGDDSNPPTWGATLDIRQYGSHAELTWLSEETPQGGTTVSVALGGGLEHPDDTLYLGVRMGQSDSCIYARDVIARRSASFTPGLTFGVGACGPPSEFEDWRSVSDPSEILHSADDAPLGISFKDFVLAWFDGAFQAGCLDPADRSPTPRMTIIDEKSTMLISAVKAETNEVYLLDIPNGNVTPQGGADAYGTFSFCRNAGFFRGGID